MTKVYAHFMQRLSNGELVERLGADGQFRIDSRFGFQRTHAEAADICKRRGFSAYYIDSYTDDGAFLVRTDVYSVEHMTDLETVSAKLNAKKRK